MPQFDVHRLRSGAGLVIDCQSPLLQQFDTRLVVPLAPPNHAPKAARRLNPSFTLDGHEQVMVTQFAAAVHVRQLGDVVGSLREHAIDIVSAIDVLISGV